MSNTRIDLFREAIALEEKRAAIQAEIDQLSSRLASIHDQLRSREVSPAPTATLSKTTVTARTTTSTRRSRGRARRGELKAQVLQALSNAGSAGLRVKDLANSLGTKAANIYSFFQTAPKRIPQIKKIGEAHYRLEGSLRESTLAAPTQAKPGRSGRKKSTRPHGKRGELAARIMEQLQAAGKQGAKVRDIAATLGVKVKNLFIWFATTGKKNKAIKKVGEGQYRLES
jgi:hypothetical protein